jgi:hypothetical protein
MSILPLGDNAKNFAAHQQSYYLSQATMLIFSEVVFTEN